MIPFPKVGTSIPSGHVDIWPNGGKAPQPGCELRYIWCETYPRWFQNVFRESLDLSCSHFLAWKLFSESILTIKQKNNRDNVPLVGMFLILGNLLQQFIQESNVKVNQHFFPLLAVKRIQSFLWLESSWIQKSEDHIIWTLSVSRFMPCHLWMRQGAFMYKMNLHEIYCLYGKPSNYIS